MTETFDQVKYWKQRHRKLRGDSRATGNMSRSSEQMLQRKLIQAYFFFALVHAILSERREGTGWLAKSNACVEPTILDIGFGTGFLGSLFALSRITYTGYDLSEIAVEDASLMSPGATYLIRNIVQDAAQESDIIIASEVLFHVVDDAQWLNALGNIAAGMRHDSIMVFTETFVAKVEPHLPHFKPRTRAMYMEGLARHKLRFVRQDEFPPSALPIFSQYAPFQNSVHLVKVAE